MLSLLLGACGGGDGAAGAPGAVGPTAPVGASGATGATGGDGMPGSKGEQGNLLKWVITDKEVKNAEPNTGYFVTNDSAEVAVTLPAAAQPGDVVRVEGSGWGGWKIAQNEKQTVKLDVKPGQTWTAQTADARWRAVATSSDGSKVVAGVEFGSGFYTSTDGGLTWTFRPLSTPTPVPVQWRSFAYSGDGKKVVGVGTGDQIYTSTNDGDVVPHSTNP